MKKTIVLLVSGFLLNPAFAQNKLPEDVVNSIRARIEYGHSPSIVVGVIDKDGKAESLTLFQNGQTILGKRIK